MKKLLTILFFSFIIFTTCEKDDFCTQNPVTTHLLINFYDNTNKETLKNVSSLYVWADTKDSIYVDETINSISIPLNSLATETVYNFSKNNVVDQFTIKYTPTEEYVSRSCGYKIVYNDITFTANNTWIKSFTPTTTLTTLNNQNEAHVQIFH